MLTQRVLTVTDLHQSRALGLALRAAVERHRPDIVAFVGDVLGRSGGRDGQFRPLEWAEFLAALPVPELVFTRGNHDQEDWEWFVLGWPHERRPLRALHGTFHTFGPLGVVGFPCRLGWDGPWREWLPRVGNELALDPEQCGRKSLPHRASRWLRPLLRAHPAAARTLWLLHEPPLVAGLADGFTGSPEWLALITRHQPVLTVSGHDHDTPRRSGRWHAHVGRTVCVNVGQAESVLHHALVEFDFADALPARPVRVRVRAFPWEEELEVELG